MIPWKTTLAILLTVAFTAGARFVPNLDWFRGPEPGMVTHAFLPEPDPVLEVKRPAAPLPPQFAYVIPVMMPESPYEPAPVPGSLPVTDPATSPPVTTPYPAVFPTEATSILDPTGAMRTFYEALARTEAKQPGAVTRVLHFGDSPVTADSVTADARAMLQAQFGDAGHGFVLIAQPWAWYGHRGIGIASKGWYMEILSQLPRARDLLHGLGGVSFTGGVNAMSRIRLPDGAHQQMDVMYLRQPNGGELRVSSDGQVFQTISTEGPVKANGFTSIRLPAGVRDVLIEVTSGTVRLFGVSFEKFRPGVLYSSLGLNGVSAQSMYRGMDAGHWTGQLIHQRPDLVVLNYGTNESVFPDYVNKQYSNELRLLIRRIKAAVPNASILVMSPMDRGERTESGSIETPPILARVVEIQKEVALENGCAFFNTWRAMGGPGTMGRWYVGRPRLVSADFMHPLPGGAAIVGKLLDSALVRGYRYWKAGAR